MITVTCSTDTSESWIKKIYVSNSNISESIYEEQEHPTNILHCSLWQLRGSFPDPNMACNKHENACQKL